MLRQGVDDLNIRVDLSSSIGAAIADKAVPAGDVGLTDIVDTAIDLRLEQLPADSGKLGIDAVFQRVAPVLNKLFQQRGELFKLADADGLVFLLLLQLCDALLSLNPGIPLCEDGAIALNDVVQLCLATLISGDLRIRGLLLLGFQIGDLGTNLGNSGFSRVVRLGRGGLDRFIRSIAGGCGFFLLLPEGCVFVLGDNRNGSTDSRYTYVGMIDERYIVGRVLLRILPIREFGVVS